MSELFDRTAAKKATNLSINTDLLSKSRALNINLSATLEQALQAELVAAEFGEKHMGRLTPVVEYQGQALIVVTPQVAAVPSKALKSAVGSLQHMRTEIIGALNFAVGGV